MEDSSVSNNIDKKKVNVISKWKVCTKKTRYISDPWKDLKITILFPVINAKRYRWNLLKQDWIEDIVKIRIEDKPFARGSMRECYRMKKLSNFVKNDNWSRSLNFVAKKYIFEVDRKTYFDDVCVQMEGKYWANLYNKRNPPKPVEMIQVCVVEITENDVSQLYHVEAYIEGKYIKYNSNSGYVNSDSVVRMTPQAFSHFTFEKSKGSLIVVDIQGVDDMYTDPQIHTPNCDFYGDANLGIKGMALFFSSHICNDICNYLGLTEFQNHEKEKRNVLKVLSQLEGSKTQVKKKIHKKDNPPIIINTTESDNEIEFEKLESKSSSGSSSSQLNLDVVSNKISSDSDIGARTDSTDCSYRVDISVGETIKKYDILGCVHYELAKYHNIGRIFGHPDFDCFYHHLKLATSYKHLESCYILGSLYVGYLDDEFKQFFHGIDVDMTSVQNVNDGIQLLEIAASTNNRKVALLLAMLYDGTLSSEIDLDWSESCSFYEKYLDIKFIEGNYSSSYQQEQEEYVITGRIGKMYLNGGHGLEQDMEKAYYWYDKAASTATALGKGKIAAGLYEILEQIA